MIRKCTSFSFFGSDEKEVHFCFLLSKNDKQNTFTNENFFVIMIRSVNEIQRQIKNAIYMEVKTWV